MKISGKAYWASVLEPKDNYAGDAKEYAIDFVPDAESRERFVKVFGTDKFKPVVGSNGKTHVSGAEHLKFKRPTTKRDGTAIQELSVVDSRGNPWPKSEAIGNGSEVSLIVSDYEWEYRGKTGIKANLDKVRVDNHVPYEAREDFDDYDEAEGFEEPAWESE